MHPENEIEGNLEAARKLHRRLRPGFGITLSIPLDHDAVAKPQRIQT